MRILVLNWGWVQPIAATLGHPVSDACSSLLCSGVGLSATHVSLQVARRVEVADNVFGAMVCQPTDLTLVRITGVTAAARTLPKPSQVQVTAQIASVFL